MNGLHDPAFAQTLCAWFTASKRLLPWRQEPTPYAVWISEIMLQQTRIEAVLPYYERFMAELPDAAALAAVDADRLMKLWEGLGYYSRVRNLQKAAVILTERYGGRMPRDYDAIRALPGIGEYTAGAIASIAFGIPVPAVDGNVLRVLARLTACEDDVLKTSTKRELTDLCATLVPKDRPGDFNQAFMELGERVCVPNTVPHCDICPVKAFCAVGGTEKAAQLPVRIKKSKRRIEEKTVLVLLTDEQPARVLLHRRPARGLLAGLWELPNMDGTCAPTLPLDSMIRVSEWAELPQSRHIFTHKEWHMTGWVAVIKPCDLPENYEFVALSALQFDRALPTAFRAYSHMLSTWLDGQQG